jgi:prepilin peptidase CpaA
LQTTSEVVAVTAVLVSAGAGAAIDLRTRRVPNVLTIPAAALGILLSAMGYVDLPMTLALMGVALGGLLMLPGYVWGGTGAGDVKLFAAVGAFLGPHLVLKAFLYSAVAGGVLAVLVALRRGRLRATIRGAGRAILDPLHAKQELEGDGPSHRFAYAPAIAAGTALAVLGF